MIGWLVRPFDRVAGGLALMLGVAVIVVTSGIGWWVGGIYTDGVLDLHVGPPNPIHVFFGMGIVAWLSLCLCLLVSGHWLTNSEYRLVDLLGTQALARFPVLLSTLLLSVPAYNDAVRASSSAVVAGGGALSMDVLVVLLLSAPPLVALAWMIWLMYHAYAIVFDLSGTRGILSFAGALLVAEMLSKGLILLLL